MTLQEIKEFAIANNACYPQLNKFIELITNGDELQAWQTVLGNYVWLRNKRFPMKLSEVEVLAQGVGKRWHPNGQLWLESNYKDGKRHGLHREWRYNGQLWIEKIYKNDKQHGLFRSWYKNGQLRVESNYKDGERDGLYREWYSDGQLDIESNYKNGELIID